MKQFNVMAAVVAALMTFTSCSKDNNGSELTGEDATVRITLRYSGNSTRAEGLPIVDLEPPFTTGHIFFARTNGTIDTHVGIGNTAGSVQVTKDDLKDGKAVITGVSSLATECYVVLNYDQAQMTGTAFNIAGDYSGRDISDIKKLKIPVGNLNGGTDNGVAKVPLYGTGITAPATGTAGGKEYTANVTVTINALASRIQIEKISAKDREYGSATPRARVKITEFKVEGIYVNNFTDTLTLGGTFGTHIHSGSDDTKYSNATGNPYATGGKGEKLYDQPTSPYEAAGSPTLAVTPLLTVTPPAIPIWAYNVFPSAPVVAPTPVQMAHIIIKLKDVKVEDSTNPGVPVSLTNPKFLTLSSFTKSGTPVTEFLRSNIYTLKNIQFDDNHLTDIPYQGTMDINVDVDIKDWFDNEIEWNN